MNTNEINNKFLCEISWEVCNMVGGIYTVLSTKAQTLLDTFSNRYVFVGPDLWKGQVNPYFEEDASVLSSWCAKACLEGLNVRTGKWKIPGSPQVILVDFESYYPHKNTVYGKMWEHFQVNSLHAYGDYDESCMFAYAASLVVDSLYHFYRSSYPDFIAHYHEWTTGMGLLNTKLASPAVATVFTTHATCIGRSIAGNHHPLYDFLEQYPADEMARQLNMEAKHSLEKQTALHADSFTTVSSITARECEHLLGRAPIVTPNGFEQKLIPAEDQAPKLRVHARQALLKLAASLIGYTPSSDAFLVGTSGRFEFKNKGYDLFLDALKVLSSRHLDREVIAFLFVPAWVGAARPDLRQQYVTPGAPVKRLDAPFITHQVYNFDEDPIIQKIKYLNFQNESYDKLKVIYLPCYLNGSDGILNLKYYDVLMGLDASVFASYYEPWGYTPHESVAFSIPTITTTLAGFGRWVKENGMGESTDDPVRVIDRRDANYSQVVDEVVTGILQLKHLNTNAIQQLRKKSRILTQKSMWNNFIEYYHKAYEVARAQSQQRIETYH